MFGVNAVFAASVHGWWARWRIVTYNEHWDEMFVAHAENQKAIFLVYHHAILTVFWMLTQRRWCFGIGARRAVFVRTSRPKRIFSTACTKLMIAEPHAGIGVHLFTSKAGSAYVYVGDARGILEPFSREADESHMTFHLILLLILCNEEAQAIAGHGLPQQRSKRKFLIVSDVL
jgi:ABC-type Fe2+-enterobactin transport system substrate-binding protein